MTASRRYTIHESELVVFSRKNLPQEIASSVELIVSLTGNAWENELGTVLISVLPNNTDSCKLLVTTSLHANTDMREPRKVITRLHELIGQNILGVSELETTQVDTAPRVFFTRGIILVDFIEKSRQ